MRPLALCAIVKNELPYLPEWLAYHRVVGVDQVLLYDNGSDVPLDSRPGAKSMWEGVSVVPYPGSNRQAEAYTDGIRRMLGKTAWVAFVDIDEFLVPLKHDSLPEVLSKFASSGGLAAHWQTFGAGGHQYRAPGLQMEAFLLRAPDDWAWNTHIKTIARPECALRALDGHHFQFRPARPCVNDRGARVDGPMSSAITHDLIQVNHYFTRSAMEFEQKLQRGAPSGNPKPREFFRVVNDSASVRDERILGFAGAVRKLLASWGINP